VGLKSHGSDESQKLLDCIKELRYREAFECGKDDKNSGVFELIRQDFNTVDVFIEIDDDATEVWQEYQSIKKIKTGLSEKGNLISSKKTCICMCSVFPNLLSESRLILMKRI